VGQLDGWKYCPRCKTALGGDAARLECEACGFVAWANSVPGAEAVIVDGKGRILLARRRDEPRAGLWDFPGGFLDEGEEPLAALLRETREETGLDVEPLEFLGLFNTPYGDRTVLSLTWLARADGETQAADDVAELRWFEPHELPWDELAFPHNAPTLKLALAREQNL
jgi:mutator protein MutT